MSAVKANAQHLVANAVPPAIIRCLPYDKLLDQIQVQKSATPVPTPQSEQEAAANLDVLRVNGVVLEQKQQR